MCRQPKTSNFIEKAAFTVVDFHPRMLFSMDFFFLGGGGGGGGQGALVNTGVKPPFCKISWLKLQKLLNLRWPSETES